MKITVVYNEPEYSRYTKSKEQEAVAGVLTEVSAVENALRSRGHMAERLGLSLKSNVLQELVQTGADVVFNLFEGFSGFPKTEPDIPEALESIGIPYTGCPPTALRGALDKYGMKTVLDAGGISTPEAHLLTSAAAPVVSMRYPCIIKPNGDDASHGLSMNSVVRNADELQRQLDLYFNKLGYGEALAEEFIDGREFNATVMGNKDLFVTGISEIMFSLPEDMPRIITYAGKWDESSIDYRGTKPVCPAPVTDRQRDTIHGIVKQAYRSAGCLGYARVDMRMNGDGDIFVLEVNPNPDISPDSGAALQAAAAGMEYPDFIEKIVTLAIERWR